MRALFVFTPAESKRLIGKAVANLEEVKRALKDDKIIIGHGSTNVYVAEEILGKEKMSEKIVRDTYISGLVIRGTLCSTLGEERPPILLINRGKIEPPALTMSEMLRDFGRDSIFIKGANAVDPEGNAGSFMAHPEGGTMGWSIGIILSRGVHFIVPVGLEKLVHSVKKAVELCGQRTLDYSQGLKVGMMPLSRARVITEIEALKILSGVKSHHVGSGGSSGSEGAVTLISEGHTEEVQKAIMVVESIKAEPALKPRKGACLTCTHTSPAQPKGYKAEGFPPRCQYESKHEEELPIYLRNR